MASPDKYNHKFALVKLYHHWKVVLFSRKVSESILILKEPKFDSPMKIKVELKIMGRWSYVIKFKVDF